MPAAAPSPAPARVTLAALDVGSGASKLDVCVVERPPPGHTGPWHLVGPPLFSQQVELLLAADMKASPDHRLSDAAMDATVDTLRRLQAVAAQHESVQLSGVATAVFRLAVNAHELLARIDAELGIRLRVLSQDEEGELGFLTAASGLAAPASGEAAPPVVAWDSGGASFQLTVHGAAGYEVYQGPLGASLVTAMLLQEVQHRSTVDMPSPNPVTVGQLDELCALLAAALPARPAWLARELAGEGTAGAAQVIGIGGTTCAFRIAEMAVGCSDYSVEQVGAALHRLVGSTDEQLRAAGYPQPEMVLPKLALIHTVMCTLGVRSVKYLACNGGCPGILTSAKFWEELS